MGGGGRLYRGINGDGGKNKKETMKMGPGQTTASLQETINYLKATCNNTSKISCKGRDEGKSLYVL